MSVVEKLASASGRKDEQMNIALAHTIAVDSDKNAVKELIENLNHKNKDIQSDCIKTLYEIGNIQPLLIASYIEVFIGLLESKNNRLQWGAMTALHAIAGEKPKEIYAVLPKLAQAADKGSVITRDHYVAILTKLCNRKEFSDDAFALLNEQLLGCPSNQLPMYAENALPAVTEKMKNVFVQTLSGRLADFEKESKRKRVEKVLKKLQGK